MFSIFCINYFYEEIFADMCSHLLKKYIFFLSFRSHCLFCGVSIKKKLHLPLFVELLPYNHTKGVIRLLMLSSFNIYECNFWDRGPAFSKNGTNFVFSNDKTHLWHFISVPWIKSSRQSIYFKYFLLNLHKFRRDIFFSFSVSYT